VLDAQARERRECSSLWTLALAARQARHVNVPAALLTLACPV
jgi:hypothetical protein